MSSQDENHERKMIQPRSLSCFLVQISNTSIPNLAPIKLGDVQNIRVQYRLERLPCQLRLLSCLYSSFASHLTVSPLTAATLPIHLRFACCSPHLFLLANWWFLFVVPPAGVDSLKRLFCPAPFHSLQRPPSGSGGP